MQPPAEGFVRRPMLAIRIGVTGMRQLTAEAAAALRPDLASVFRQIRDRVLALSNDPIARALYAPGAPLLRVISPLAEGSDRLAATEALALGFQLEAPLPFPREEYVRDFPATIVEFSTLLNAAQERVLELDGARGREETRSYEAVGRLVVRNCDVLVAVWDGEPARGRGGTAEIVRYAAETGRPVWWLDAGGGVARWIDRPDHLHVPAHFATGTEATARLDAYLKRTIVPTSILPAAATLFAETPLPDRALWKTHATVMRWAAGAEGSEPVPQPRPAPAEPAGAHWHSLYAAADRLAIDYGRRYRSSYVLVVLLASAALGLAILGVQFHDRAGPVTVVEFLLLAGIGSLVVVNQRRRWHGRLITYRLLAELFRKQGVLATLGGTLPAAETGSIEQDRSPGEEPHAGRDAEQARDRLIGWYFSAALRAAPLPRGKLGGAGLAAAYRGDYAALIDDQIEYHAARERVAAAAAHRFSWLGGAFFLGTLVIVGIKLALLGLMQIAPHAMAQHLSAALIVAIGLAAALMPAASAAFVGIRSYAELELLAHQSAYMQGVLARAQARLGEIDLDAPLASQDLGAELLHVAETMLVDVRGWVQIFRAKALEPGG